MPVVVPEGLEAEITAREAAAIAGVNVATIRSWVSRGHLTAAGRNEQGHPVYRLLDVAKAERATRDRARRTYQQAG